VAISPQDRKLLWGRASATCSICKAPLTERAGNGDPEAVLGDECHIIARSPDGPRGRERLPGIHVDSYANLILLCAYHHRLVDAKPSAYTVPELLRIKDEHESWVLGRLSGGVEEGASSLAAKADALEESLRRHSALRYGTIDVPSTDVHTRVRIDDLYVPTRFVLDDDPPPTLYEQLARKTFRVVILGNPGSGKSTLARKWCYDLATGAAPLMDELTPVGVLLPLRAISSALTRDRALTDPLRAALDHAVIVEMQQSPEPEAFELLLRAGRIAPIFDGLDEMPDLGLRRRIRNELETFAERYPKAPIIVTSRIVGYDSAPLTRLRFRHARMDDFGEEQVKIYARKWFASTVQPSAAAKEMSARFLDATDGVRDLRRSPLMLGLLCTSYRHHGAIGRSRTSVYQQTARLMFENWDRMRGLEAPPVEPWFREVLAYLAWTMLTDPMLAAGVTARVAISMITNYLTDAAGWNPEHAAAAALELLEYSVGRAWVFTEIGTAAGEGGVFQFTHRTFLEYFAAEHLAVRLAPRSARSVATLRRLRDGDETVPLLVAQLLADAADVRDEFIADLRAVSDGPADSALIDTFSEHVEELLSTS
jgi:hypothetical protein